MKIKTKVLSGFLKKVKMIDSCEVKEMLLKFEAEGLNILVTDPENNAGALGNLNKAAFKEYEPIGNIGFDDMATIVKVLDRFGEFVTLTTEGNLLTISEDNKKVEVELVAENFIKQGNEQPNLEYVDTFEITSTMLASFINDVKLNSDTEIIIETEPQKVILKNTGKYKFEKSFEAKTCEGGASSRFGKPFIHAVNNLDGTLEVSVGKDFPVKVLEKTENCNVSLVIAPRTDD